MFQQMLQQMTQNPEMMQQMIQQNPMVQQLAQSNPQVRKKAEKYFFFCAHIQSKILQIYAPKVR